MNEQRLLETATLLYFVEQHKDAREHFNMSRYKVDASKPICQTTVCTVAYATEMYKGSGFTLKPKTYNQVFPSYKGESHREAIALFYDISIAEVQELFGSHIRTAKEEADYICNFVEKVFHFFPHIG